MKTWNQTLPLLRNDEQKVVANGYQDLRVNGVLCGSVECLGVQTLLDPLEEQFNLPPLAVQLCNGQRVLDGEVVRQEAIDLSGFKVLMYNKPHLIGTLPEGGVTGKTNCLIRKNTGAFVNRIGLKNLVGHVVFGPGDKGSTLQMEVLVKFLESDISFVHQVEGTGFNGDLVHPLASMTLPGERHNLGEVYFSFVHSLRIAS